MTLPKNAQKASSLAQENGWAVALYPTEQSLLLRFTHCEPAVIGGDVPRVAALWGDGHFTFALARNGFRLGYRDLLAVLADPGLLLDFDPEDPFDYEAKQAEKEAKDSA